MFRTFLLHTGMLMAHVVPSFINIDSIIRATSPKTMNRLLFFIITVLNSRTGFGLLFWLRSLATHLQSSVIPVLVQPSSRKSAHVFLLEIFCVLSSCVLSTISTCQAMSTCPESCNGIMINQIFEFMVHLFVCDSFSTISPKVSVLRFYYFIQYNTKIDWCIKFLVLCLILRIS